MPNINLLQTITTTTDNNSYFIVSDSGLARRFKYDNLVNQIRSSIPDSNRTDQNLFTTDDVTFRSVTTYDYAATANSTEIRHGFQSIGYHPGGTALEQRDIIGSLRFGGFDGNNNTILDNNLSTAGLLAFAAENWQNVGAKTSHAGTGISIYCQPTNTELTTSSRATVFSVSSTGTNASQAVMFVRLGNVPTEPHVITTASNGIATFTGPGRADVAFVNSRITQVGLPQEDPSPVNITLPGTNYYTFLTGRHHTYNGYKEPLKHDDTLGIMQFRGINTTTNDTGITVALIRAHTTCDYSSDNHGAGIHIRTMSSGTNAQLITSLDIQPEGHLHVSDFHKFYNRDYTNPLTITNGTIVFDNGSVQSTAYQGFTSVPASSSSAGITGQMACDSTYFYICIGTNQWKRIAASDF